MDDSTTNDACMYYVRSRHTTQEKICVALYRLQCGRWIIINEEITAARHRVRHTFFSFIRSIWMLCMTHCNRNELNMVFCWAWEFSRHAVIVRRDINAFTYLLKMSVRIPPNEKGINYIIISLINMFGFVSIVSNEKSQFHSFRSFIHSFIRWFFLLPVSR